MLRASKVGGVLGVILAMSLVLTAGASAAKEKPVLAFMLQEPSQNALLPQGDEVQIDATAPVKFNTGTWSIECAAGALTGTVDEETANELKLSLTKASFTGPKGTGACTSTLGNAYISFGDLPWTNTLSAKGKAELKPENGESSLGFTVALPLEGREEGLRCSYATSGAVKSSFNTNAEPITLSTDGVKVKAAKGDQACPKTGTLQSNSWALTAKAQESESFYPVALSVYDANPPKEPLPAPPAEIGCYNYKEGIWLATKCEEESTLPPAEDVPGIRRGRSGGPITLGTLWVAPVFSGTFGQETDSLRGGGHYSIQLNTNYFVGNQPNFNDDWVQFIDQVEPAFPGGNVNHICIEQWEISSPPNQKPKWCDPNVPITNYHTGTVLEGYITPFLFGTHFLNNFWGGVEDGHWTQGVAIVTGDDFGLGEDNRWTNVDGTIFGYANSSEAHFTQGAEIHTGLGASSCQVYDTTFGLGPFPETCNHSHALEPDAQLNLEGGTGESNNLTPVSPPHVLYRDGKYAAEIEYTATVGGKCSTGSPPYCY